MRLFENALAIAAINRPFASEEMLERSADASEPASDLVDDFGKRVVFSVALYALGSLVALIVNLFVSLVVVIVPRAILRVRDGQLKSCNGAGEKCNEANG